MFGLLFFDVFLVELLKACMPKWNYEVCNCIQAVVIILE